MVLTVKLQCPLQMCPVHFMMSFGFSMFSTVVCDLSPLCIKQIYRTEQDTLLFCFDVGCSLQWLLERIIM